MFASSSSCDSVSAIQAPPPLLPQHSAVDALHQCVQCSCRTTLCSGTALSGQLSGTVLWVYPWWAGQVQCCELTLFLEFSSISCAHFYLRVIHTLAMALYVVVICLPTHTGYQCSSCALHWCRHSVWGRGLIFLATVWNNHRALAI